MASARGQADEYHQQFAERIIPALKEGTAPWQKPCPPYIVSVSRPATSHDVYNYLIYR